MSTPAWVRAALSRPVFTGLSRQHLAEVTVELAKPWTAAHQSALQQRRGHPRQRAAGAGPHHRRAQQWRCLQRWIGRRQYYAETHLAVAGLVSDRAARR